MDGWKDGRINGWVDMGTCKWEGWGGLGWWMIEWIQKRTHIVKGRLVCVVKCNVALMLN